MQRSDNDEVRHAYIIRDVGMALTLQGVFWFIVGVLVGVGLTAWLTMRTDHTEGRRHDASAVTQAR